MTDTLSRLASPLGATKTSRRLGRGPGSGLGKTCGRGNKGAKKRNKGSKGRPHFQGGQTPLQRRLPKRGFRVPDPIKTAVVKLSHLDRFEAGTVVDEARLRQTRLVQGVATRIKVLGEGELTKTLVVHAHAFSAKARQQIEKAGGQVLLIESASTDSEPVLEAQSASAGTPLAKSPRK